MSIGNYPKDIRDAANEAAARCPVEWSVDSDLIRFHLIADAILSERNRCTNIARRERHNTLSFMSMPPQSMASRVIEKAILAGAPA